MKAILLPAVLGLMCGLAAAYQNPTGVDASNFSTVEAVPTPRLHALHRRRLEREDPANPVAAAATDPNVAAMKIRSRDLIPTDRPDPYRHRHPAGHAHPDDDDDSPGGDSDGGDPKSGNRRGGKGAADKRKHSPTKDDDDADNRVEDDDEGNDGKHGNKPKPAGGGSKPKDKSGGKDGDKRPKDAKNDKKEKDAKKKKTHTGLDGNEVADDNDNDEDSEESEILKKKMLVKHIQAKRRLWRTGQPKYDYKKAMAGWKEVGPLYYYRGKYANTAATTPRGTAASIALPILVSAMVYAAWI
ncbi:hypothetical protein IW146_003392 [Coemansia sp. RSA 922]|nr:hypothetical protein H4S03_006260 [Coemansia sp. S3946]KAJ2051692.1 hypothetical protein GGI08_005202 [Coemansia sp. S2]KAJ2063284.1 hypothetical protein GGH13_006316 [Coemansia sp. S155-1]KAJ2114038.1 hypothetical protein IW146_003392 [Coemansia sp. RSA 922]KAJ2345865.1 hypothetical protein GGH92_003866 [Coemansia sp. RSA 2673]